MKFGSALEGLKGGHQIRRTCWQPHVHLRMFRAEGEIGPHLRVPLIAVFTPEGVYKPFTFDQESVIEEDWELVS